MVCLHCCTIGFSCYRVKTGWDQRLPWHFWLILYNVKNCLLVVNNCAICCISYKWGVLLSIFKICFKLSSEAGDGFLLSWDSWVAACNSSLSVGLPFPAQLAWDVASVRASLQEHHRWDSAECLFSVLLLYCHLVLQYYVDRNPVNLFALQYFWLDFVICIAARFKWRIIIKSAQILMFPTSSSLVETNPDFWEL